MTFADLVVHRTGSAAALAQGAGEDTLLALHHAMSRMLDSAGSNFGFGFRFGKPDIPPLASDCSRAVVRAGVS